MSYARRIAVRIQVSFSVSFSLDVFSSGEYIRVNLDGDYIESDDDAFRIIARQLTSPVMRRRFCSRSR